MNVEEILYASPDGKTNFEALARKDEEFRELWARGKLDFRKPETTATVSRALLRVCFDLELNLPEDRLCPTVTNRWEYTKWVIGLVESSSPNYEELIDTRNIIGLDIGTGASAIYAMLLLKARPLWCMRATDIDYTSYKWASANLEANNLDSRTKLLLAEENDDLVPWTKLELEHLDFTVCNPPFFHDEAEMRSSLQGEGKGSIPRGICSGSTNEMVHPGGDLAFAQKIFNQSLVLRENVAWYTCMFGKKASFETFIRTLADGAINNFAVGCIQTSSSTKRWLVGWSYGDLRPNQEFARSSSVDNYYLPFPVEYHIRLKSDAIQNAQVAINSKVAELDLRWAWDCAKLHGICEAPGNVWNREYRRSKKVQRATLLYDATKIQVAFVFRIRVLTRSSTSVVIDWLRGRDHVIFESFCGWLHRILKEHEPLTK